MGGWELAKKCHISTPFMRLCDRIFFNFLLEISSSFSLHYLFNLYLLQKKTVSVPYFGQFHGRNSMLKTISCWQSRFWGWFSTFLAPSKCWNHSNHNELDNFHIGAHLDSYSHCVFPQCVLFCQDFLLRMEVDSKKVERWKDLFLWHNCKIPLQRIAGEVILVILQMWDYDSKSQFSPQ